MKLIKSVVSPRTLITRGVNQKKTAQRNFGTYKQGLKSERDLEHRAPAKGHQAKAISMTLASPARARRHRFTPQGQAKQVGAVVDDAGQTYARLSNGQNILVRVGTGASKRTARRGRSAVSVDFETYSGLPRFAFA